MDDFGCKVKGNHGQHLIDTLRQYYTISVDETGSLYAGMRLKWDYPNKTVESDMPGYIDKGLQKLKHPKPTRKVNNPVSYTHLTLPTTPYV